jgi:HSP20 family molecular chaperone IbpA
MFCICSLQEINHNFASFLVQVEFSVKDYRPEELSIKTEGDVLIVMGKHETKSEGGSSFISKQFEQKFSLPSGVP